MRSTYEQKESHCCWNISSCYKINQTKRFSTMFLAWRQQPECVSPPYKMCYSRVQKENFDCCREETNSNCVACTVIIELLVVFFFGYCAIYVKLNILTKVPYSHIQRERQTLGQSERPSNHTRTGKRQLTVNDENVFYPLCFGQLEPFRLFQKHPEICAIQFVSVYAHVCELVCV